MPGICTSVSATSKSPARRASSAARPSRTSVTTKTAAHEILLQERAQVRLVLGDQHAHRRPRARALRRLHGHAASGSTTRKVLPSPGALSTAMRPPWSRTMP